MVSAIFFLERITIYKSWLTTFAYHCISQVLLIHRTRNRKSKVLNIAEIIAKTVSPASRGESVFRLVIALYLVVHWLLESRVCKAESRNPLFSQTEGVSGGCCTWESSKQGQRVYFPVPLHDVTARNRSNLMNFMTARSPRARSCHLDVTSNHYRVSSGR